MKALICGVTGQDGAYLSRFLLEKQYDVWGTTRTNGESGLVNLHYLGIRDQINIVTMDPVAASSVKQVINYVRPNEVYFLSGLSSVGKSFLFPTETMESIVVATTNILEACRKMQNPPRLYNAGSSECFGNTGLHAANEETPFSPCSPYGIAKTASCSLVRQYRKSAGVWACNGLLFNHESPLRPQHFVTQKVVTAARNIAAGIENTLSLGSLNVARDWGWAPEYVEAMWKMLQQDAPSDYVIATGHTRTLQELVDVAFSYFDLDYRNYVKRSEEQVRSTELDKSSADPSKAREKLRWTADKSMEDVVWYMIKAIE
jgi:GDPmannose 4,6-dehydratase